MKKLEKIQEDELKNVSGGAVCHDYKPGPFVGKCNKCGAEYTPLSPGVDQNGINYYLNGHKTCGEIGCDGTLIQATYTKTN